MQTVNRFVCKNEHVFFIHIPMPIPIDDFVKLSENLQCPICQNTSDSINIDATKFIIQEVSEL